MPHIYTFTLMPYEDVKFVCTLRCKMVLIQAYSISLRESVPIGSHLEVSDIFWLTFFLMVEHRILSI